MSDKIRELTNQVKLTGRIVEVETKFDKTKEKGVPYVSIKGAIQFGKTKAETRRFESFVQQENSKGGENKLYDPTLAFAKAVKSVAKVGTDEATVVGIEGSFEPNDYVNSNDVLVEGLRIKATFFNDADEDDEFKGEANVEGYINSIEPEIDKESEEETGRLRVELLTTNFFGDIIPVKNIIVPEDLSEDFESEYEVGQTAKLFLDFIPKQAEAKSSPNKKGLGKHRSTDGKNYVELVLVGADPAIDEDDESGKGISSKAIRIGLSERKAKLQEIKDAGYQGNKGGDKKTKSTSRTKSAPSKKSKPEPIEDIDNLF